MGGDEIHCSNFGERKIAKDLQRVKCSLDFLVLFDQAKRT
jgi:hypothetical protein